MTMFTEDEEISPPFKQYPNFSFSDEFFEFVSPLEDDNSPHSTPLFCSGYGLSEYNNQEENSSNNSFEEILIFQEHIVSSEAFQNIFEQLPTELLMEIFLHIFPDKQIFRNLTLVCKYWKAILDSEHFWKKANKTWLGGPKKGLLEKKKSWKEFVLSSASHWTHCQMQEELVEKFQSLKRNAAIGNYVSWFWSCEKGHIELVKRLLYGDKGYIYLNARDKRGRTALYHASRNGHHHIVDLLLSHFPIKNSKNDINNFNNEEENDENINQAIVESNDENKKLMIEINCKLCDGTTPLLSACQHGHYNVVKILLKYNADVNESRNSGASPLYLASQEGHAKVVKLLLKSNAEVDTVRKVGATPLYIAAQNGHLNVVDLLIKASANVDKKRNSGTTPLHVACHEGNIEVVKRLLLANADVNNPRESGQTCLFIACYHGNLQLVSLLLQHKPNVNTQPSPLVVACQRGEYKIVKLLLKAGADPNLLSNNVTPLIIACQFSMPKIVSLLLKYNSNPNVTRLYDNLTPLSIACQLNALPIVKKLIYAGADPNFAPNGELPLHIAIFNSSFSIVKFLLSKPDNSLRILNNEAENIDNFAISSIEMNEKQKVRRERLTANVNSTSAAENSKFAIFGESAIHIASRFGNLKMIKLLIKRGANINALRPNGDNAEVIAKKSNNKEIASYLHQMRHQNKIENHQSFSSMVVKLHRMLSNF